MTDDEWEQQCSLAILAAFQTGRPVFADTDGELRYDDGTREQICADVGVAMQPIPRATVLAIRAQRGSRWAFIASGVAVIGNGIGSLWHPWQLAVAAVCGVSAVIWYRVNLRQRAAILGAMFQGDAQNRGPREAVFARDGHRCVICGAPAVDAHHLVERKLWPNGGYFLDNGASVCEDCHLKAESTEISCDELRQRCGIDHVHLPDHFCPGDSIDKWGNPILPNGQRLRGELFDDESVQKVLAPVLHLFTSRVKYPRTFHLSWSPGATADDRVMNDPDEAFSMSEVVVTEKMDGECSTLYRDYLHARGVDYAPHPSRDRLRALHASIAHDIPDGWRVCGENVYAVHSIAYNELPSHFLVFSVWNGRNECLSWDETVTWAQLLGLHAVPVLYRGPWNAALVRPLDDLKASQLGGDREGYVVRLAGSFHYRAFRRSVAKYVRKDHVQTDDHWKTCEVVANRLREEAR